MKAGASHQVLLGVTGSGKTFTAANVISQWNRPVLVLSPNKVLAAQLYSEFKSYFPDNAVEYFISYYDYYQPEAYIPQTDTYIEKDAAINEHIERLRLKTTASLLSRRDVIVVASVSCIYNIGDPEDFERMCIYFKEGDPHSRDQIAHELVALQYERNDVELAPGRFRGRGAMVEVYPPYLDGPVRLYLQGDTVARIEQIHNVSGQVVKKFKDIYLFPRKHFVTPRSRIEVALQTIADELREHATKLKLQNKLLEAQRLESRTKYDLAMMRSMGFCHGIENYSRHLSGRAPGERPFCLIDYLRRAAGEDKTDFLTIIDESHVSVSQVRGMYNGDHARKEVLIEHGFRLPSAMDNRPLKFDEFESLLGPVIYVSATPGPYELSRAGDAISEQIVRPTGLVDPVVEIHPIRGQIEHLIGRIEVVVGRKERVLVNTLTKRTAEDLCEFFLRRGLRVRYLHSDIESLERIKILKELRLGNFDVLVGVNMLREGLDLPEVSLVAVLDADKEGFLRSETTLIQIAGRAARNVRSQVIFYADQRTGSMDRALKEMDRRRVKQLEHNKKHKITPRTIVKEIHEHEEFEAKAKIQGLTLMREALCGAHDKKALPELIKEFERQMNEAADRLDYELAATLRDQLFEMKTMLPRDATVLGPKNRK